MVRKFFVIPVMMLSFMHAGHAQLSETSQDPARIKWRQIRTEGYRFIYPEGCDSIAADYAVMFEKYRIPVSGTSGFLPARMSVVLHPENASGDFSISEFPFRIDMPVLPQGRLNYSRPASELAAVYLSRRAAHLNFGSSGVFRPFSWFFGELFPVAVNILYPDTWLLDGDAAIAATTLIPEGYGRYGDFLNYYMAALDAGDVRGYRWDRWAIGSPKYYTPDGDAFGYLILSGLRTMYDKPDYVGDYLVHTSKRPYDVFYGMKLSRKTTGTSLHSHAFRKILDCHREVYARELKARAPFTESHPLLRKENRKYAEYSRAAVLPDGTVFAVKKTLDSSYGLVSVSPDGKERRIAPFPSSGSRIVWSEATGRLYWSETESDWRWGQKHGNVLKSYDLRTGRIRRLKADGNIFNPCVSGDGRKIAAIYGPGPERTSVIILDAKTGDTMEILPFPTEGILFTGCAWVGDDIYVSGVSREGSAILKAEKGGSQGHSGWTKLIGTGRYTVRDIGRWKDKAVFSCDASGVFDMYCIDRISPDIAISKLTSTRYGAKDFVFSNDGKRLYFSRLDNLGYDLRYSGTEELSRSEAVLSKDGSSPIAKELTLQEARIAEQLDEPDTVISSPVKYRKGLHLFRLHSWAPVYCDIGKLSDFSGEKLYDYVSVGATVLSQNVLGTAYGGAGYCWRPDPDGSGWVHGGYLNFSYAGWYPVIEGTLYINDRVSWNYMLNPDGSILRKKDNGVSIAGRIDMYVPLSRKSGGMTVNFVPMISWEIDNSRYNGLLNHSTTVSGRFWMLRDKADAEIFPRYGVGVETGVRVAFAAGLKSNVAIKLSDSWYMHAYGYFPGIFPGQGGKISMTTNALIDKGIFNPPSDILPRGLEGSIMRDFYNPSFTALLAFDYAVPVYLGDVNITPLIYLNRMVLTPHFDYCYSRQPRMHLFSAGTSLTFQLGRLLWAFPLEIGVDYSYNFGTLFPVMEENGSKVARHSVKPVIKISF